jgi:hypothetical protein
VSRRVAVKNPQNLTRLDTHNPGRELTACLVDFLRRVWGLKGQVINLLSAEVYENIGEHAISHYQILGFSRPWTPGVCAHINMRPDWSGPFKQNAAAHRTFCTARLVGGFLVPRR